MKVIHLWKFKLIPFHVYLIIKLSLNIYIIHVDVWSVLVFLRFKKFTKNLTENTYDCVGIHKPLESKIIKQSLVNFSQANNTG